ncbi:MAG TPA: 4Fe-4S dicluster domain-containing protein [Flavobacteriaceae bacterium]|nr:4Fe-4S dicluster domain-containing protein [Flavobacteriaceae bacterium]
MKKCAFVFDTNKCVGCMACVVGCSIENNTNTSFNWREVSAFNEINHPDLPLFHLSMACNHCDDAPCMKHCPAMAYKRDEETGAILHIAEACIGCTYCTWACPYDAPKYNTATKIIEKCNFCINKIKVGLKTACATACPVGALDFTTNTEIDYNQLNNIITTEINPSIKVIPLKESMEKPKVINSNEQQVGLNNSLHLFSKPKSKITLAKEWTLVLFTLTVAVLVALFSAFVTHNLSMSLPLFITVSLAAIALSSFHVGKKWRLWRFVLNLKNSWLSREILGFSLFIIFGSLTLFFTNHNSNFEIATTTLSLLKYLTIGLGAFTLIAVDMVYKFLIREDKVPIHSASIVLTSIFLYAWFTSGIGLIVISSSIKVILYLLRKITSNKNTYKSILLSLVRLGLIVIPTILFIVYPQISILVLIPLIFISEVIDRSEFYIEFDVITPKKYIINNFNKVFNVN